MSRHALLSIGLFFAIVLQRIAPHLMSQPDASASADSLVLWNFSPVMAVCLFGGARFYKKHWAFAVPLGGMLLSDLILLIWQGPSAALYPHQPLVYLCFAFAVFLGFRLRNTRQPAPIIGSALLGELVFFAVTNFGVWLLFRNMSPTFYSPNLAGLMTCYAAGIPFLFRSLCSTFIYTAGLFAIWELAGFPESLGVLKKNLAGQHIR